MLQSRYRILEQVGQGQFGQVFCGLDRETNRLVALKAFHPKRLPTSQFLRELRLLTGLQHPNIVTFRGLEYCPEGRYLVMDYCEAGTLRQVMDSVGQLSLTQSLKLIIDILRGLSYAHTEGIIHRDLKPENILLTVASKGWTAQISDFGIARSIEDLNGEGIGLGDTGSPAYMAPEQFYGQYSYASDLYSIGILLFELVVGERPFSGIPAALMHAHMNQPLVIPKTVPFLVQSVIRTALQKLPQRRYASANDMLKAVRLAAKALAGTEPSSTFKSAQGGIVSLHQEPLSEPIHCITVDAQEVYWGMGNTVYCRFYADRSLTGKIMQEQQMHLHAPVVRIDAAPQGCYVFTRSSLASPPRYSLYCLPTPNQLPIWGDAIASEHLSEDAPFLQPSWLLNSWLAPDLVAAIEPQGSWMAICNTKSTVPVSAPEPIPQTQPQSLCQIWQLPGLQSIPTAIPGPSPTQLIALDSRHGLSVLPTSRDLTKGTHTLRLFNRRGDYLDYFHLPIAVQLVTVSATSPYRLLAIEQGGPKLGLLINLRPLKIMRLALPLTPTFVVATDWGYILADQERQVVLLDQEGAIIDQFELSLGTDAQITSLCPFADYGLMVATWSGHQGQFYTFDLQY